MKINAVGYDDAEFDTTITNNVITYKEIFLKTQIKKGLVKGKITNSHTNTSVEGVTLTICKGWDWILLMRLKSSSKKQSLNTDNS